MQIFSSARIFPAIGLIAALAACSGGDAADNELDRDLALASEMQPTPELKLDDKAPPAAQPAPAKAQPRPQTAAPRPAAPAPQPVSSSGSVSAGSRVILASDSRVCTNTHRVGDRFEATLRDGVVGSNGAAIPAGSKGEFEVTELKRSENSRDEIVIGLALRAIIVNGKRYAAEGETKDFALEKVRASNDAKKVVGGAAVGAVVGQVIGKDTRSTVIGAATGAAAGTAAAVATANHEGCVPADGRIEVVLSRPITLPRA